MLISKLGRKGTMMGASVFYALSYLCLVAAQNVWMLFIGRFLCGLSTGITSIATPTYVSETVSPHVRGMLGSCFQLMITIGVLYMDVLGALGSWRWLSVAGIALSLVWGLLLLWTPESPAYLLSQKDIDGARRAMVFLRGHLYIETELAEVQRSMEEAATKTFR
jgi:MFS family permease